ncbi:DDE domain protein [Bacillus clarus]|uniref:DDE domain protein n=1 Tax=Bacillus clarus TaxID=2338372 RepID=A0A090ZJA1_9BACI|nr:DDE domain protein [Bacillus clarus]
MYLQRAVDSEGDTIDFYLTRIRNHKATKQIRHVKYLNTIVEQNYRFIKKRVCSILGFQII